MKMLVKFKQAPLPFQGQKRNFVVEFCKEISQLPDDTIFVDLFGGSGLLSRAAKDVKPNCRVVYNDFDNFQMRVKAIPVTNAILSDLRLLFKEVEKEKKIPSELREKAISLIEGYSKISYVDIITISSSLLFSPKYATSLDSLKNESTFYNCIRQSDYKHADDYFYGLECRSTDFRMLYEEFKNSKKVFFICDPPYLNTDVSMYSCYWKLRDYLDVLSCLKMGQFVFFTSEKSALIDLLDWAEKNVHIKNPLSRAKRVEINSTVNGTNRYKDIMLIRA